MPLIKHSNYKAHFSLFNGHLQTLIPGVFRNVKNVVYEREKINTPDHDFLYLDWSGTHSKKLAIISHGIEGSSHSPYVKGMVKELNKNGWDALAWNYRSCGGELNKTPGLYYGGDTDDITIVINHAIAKNKYNKICLIGFSIGGNLILKYLGEQGKELPKLIKRAVVFSAPLDLESSSKALSKPQNFIYEFGLLYSLKKKIKVKIKQFPDKALPNLKTLGSFEDFAHRFTAPSHGFKDAQAYYRSCSSIHFLPFITIPTLIISAKNDPLLTHACFPYKLAKKSPLIYLEVPEVGGHLGFIKDSLHEEYWSEERAIEFINNIYLTKKYKKGKKML